MVEAHSSFIHTYTVLALNVSFLISTRLHWMYDWVNVCSFFASGHSTIPHRSQGVLQGSTQELCQRKEEGREGAALHLQGPVHHRPGRLAEGSRYAQELDKVVVRPQARTSAHLQKPESESKFYEIFPLAVVFKGCSYFPRWRITCANADI